MPEDLPRLARRPVVEDLAQEEDVSGAVGRWLRGEEVVGLEAEAGGDGVGELGRWWGKAGEGSGEVLHGDVEGGVVVGEEDGGFAC